LLPAKIREKIIEVRPIWNGSLTFGLVVIPVRLYAATEKKRISFNLLHRACNSPIRYMKWCPVCEKEVEQEDIIRAYQYDKGRYVTFSDEELESVHGRTSSHTIEIMDFVRLGEVDPVYFDKSFFLEPREGAEKAYSLLRETMNEEGKVAVARVALRAKETLAVVRGYGRGFLIMETMYWGDEVRKGEELVIPLDIPLDQREIEMAETLIKTLTSKFTPEKYKSQQRETMSELVKKKKEGEEIVSRPEKAQAEVIDLMEALRRSVEKAKAKGEVGRGRGKKRVSGSDDQNEQLPAQR
jgi:DNA end-binding protein Ku